MRIVRGSTQIISEDQRIYQRKSAFLMKSNELQNKTREELSTMLKDLKAKLLQFNFELGEKRLKDFSQVGKTKREIARILTVVNQKHGE